MDEVKVQNVLTNLAIEIAELRMRLDQALAENKVLRAMAADHTHEEEQEAQ